MDFLQTHGVLLDFSTTPVKVGTTKMPDVSPNQEPATLAIYKAEQTEKIKRYSIAVLQDVTDGVDECAIPWFNQEGVIELPHSSHPSLQQLLQQYQQLFRCSPGKTSLAYTLVLHNTTFQHKVHQYMYLLEEFQLTIKHKFKYKSKIC